MDRLAIANLPIEQYRSISLREIVDRDCKNSAERLPNQPMVEAAIRTTETTPYSVCGKKNDVAVFSATP